MPNKKNQRKNHNKKNKSSNKKKKLQNIKNKKSPVKEEHGKSTTATKDTVVTLVKGAGARIMHAAGNAAQHIGNMLNKTNKNTPGDVRLDITLSDKTSDDEDELDPIGGHFLTHDPDPVGRMVPIGRIAGTTGAIARIPGGPMLGKRTQLVDFKAVDTALKTINKHGTIIAEDFVRKRFTI